MEPSLGSRLVEPWLCLRGTTVLTESMAFHTKARRRVRPICHRTRSNEFKRKAIPLKILLGQMSQSRTTQMTVRAKFRVTGIELYESPKGSGNVKLSAGN